MLLGIQLALVAIGVVVLLRGQMSGARGREVSGARARLAGLVLVVMAGWSALASRGLEATPEGVDRLALVAVQCVWLLGAMIVASMVGGAGVKSAQSRRRALA
ncbi:MAG: hypothetical protein KDA05_06905 [Phycisphaerales bacterium]|nr:hypothetical protein [Phycisphaerales bacterium]MCB9840541.1 hypothetical protein [Phycisphaeraceae bacterium]